MPDAVEGVSDVPVPQRIETHRGMSKQVTQNS